MRAILDPNVIISALLAPDGSPAKVLRAELDGAYDLDASSLLLAERERALSYSKLRRRIPASDATAAIISWAGRLPCVQPHAQLAGHSDKCG